MGAHDMSAREHGTLNVQSSLKGLHKDEHELLRVAHNLAKSGNQAEKTALLATAKQVGAEERKEEALTSQPRHEKKSHKPEPATEKAFNKGKVVKQQESKSHEKKSRKSDQDRAKASNTGKVAKQE